jgi:hypothetical protein
MCYYAECHYSECRYAKCLSAEIAYHDRVDRSYESPDEDESHDGEVGDGVKGKAGGVQHSML